MPKNCDPPQLRIKQVLSSPICKEFSNDLPLRSPTLSTYLCALPIRINQYFTRRVTPTNGHKIAPVWHCFPLAHVWMSKNLLVADKQKIRTNVNIYCNLSERTVLMYCLKWPINFWLRPPQAEKFENAAFFLRTGLPPGAYRPGPTARGLPPGAYRPR